MSKKHSKYAIPGANPWEEVEPGMTLRDYFAAKAILCVSVWIPFYLLGFLTTHTSQPYTTIHEPSYWYYLSKCLRENKSEECER